MTYVLVHDPLARRVRRVYLATGTLSDGTRVRRVGDAWVDGAGVRYFTVVDAKAKRQRRP